MRIPTRLRHRLVGATIVLGGATSFASDSEAPTISTFRPAHCRASQPSSTPSSSSTKEHQDRSAGYAEWLASRGVQGVENITLSDDDGDASLSDRGQHLYPSRWKRLGRNPNPAVVMTFPLDGGRVVSESTVAADPTYAACAEKGYDILILYLMIERMKDEHGQADAWMHRVARRQLSAPVTWGFNEIDWLRGTSLYRAVMHQRDALKQQWEQGGVRQACTDLARSAGLRSPTFEDYTWATAAFTLFAVPLEGDGDGDGQNPHGGRHDLHSLHSLQIVPGLEVFRPASGSATATSCHLDVDEAKQQLCVVCPKPAPGSTLVLSHRSSPGDDDDGDDDGEEQSVEQLLFTYGVLDADPSCEVLMIECPIPPVEQWDASIKRRFALLLEDDLRPQLFLSRRRVGGIAKTAGEKAGNTSARQRRFEDMFPPGVRETISIFVMDDDQVRDRIQGGGAGDRAGARADGTHVDPVDPVAASGMRMAVLTTVVRLLELKQYELESDEKGTGSLEADQRLSESIDAEQRGTTAMPHSGPTTRQRAALRHRMSQKLLVREYLRVYGEALQDEMAYLRALVGDGGGG